MLAELSERKEALLFEKRSKNFCDYALVTGASGVLGRAVVNERVERGMNARGMGRRAMPVGFPAEWARADLLGGGGLNTALHGVHTVIHCASDPYRPESDPVALGRLIEAIEVVAEVHIIHVGIAGIERAARRFAYYDTKLRCEQALVSSGMPHTILRATQFHSFIAFLLRHLDARLVQIAPRRVRLQPVAVEFVANRLLHYAQLAPAGRTPDVHGPETLSMDELAQSWLHAQRRRTPVISLPLGLQPFRACSQLDQVSGDQGGLPWHDWLSRNDLRVKS